MTVIRKIYLFYCFLIANHLLHTYEIYTIGYQKEKNLLISNQYLFFILQILFLVVLIYIGMNLLRLYLWAFQVSRVAAVMFLLYGALLAFGNVYQEDQVIGSFTGFIHVMISFPMILWISDYLKKKGGDSHKN